MTVVEYLQRARENLVQAIELIETGQADFENDADQASAMAQISLVEYTLTAVMDDVSDIELT